ncbi:ABC transporter substrate-binding protein [Ornithinibacillus sp. 4-3]|uniref:ABC transporter substrate-binding protein n=1 Tax=Ornithinibacillus sp. 4-3 TaxID=3231488 RepID=A0AB39HV58_9BACI
MRKIWIFTCFLTLIVLVGCNNSSDSTAPNSSEGVVEGGGELIYAINTQPPTIDPVMSTAAATRDVARNIFETLVTLDSKYEAVPMLAESWEASDDNKTYTFKLREGVIFHNGNEMIAEDVVASMNRWKGMSSTGQSLLENAEFIEVDDYTVELQLEEPSIFAVSILAGTTQFAGIMPKEIIEAASAEGVQEYVGTGPFEFAEWKQDQYIHLTKYDGYQSLDSPTDGLGGKKEALVDDLYFQIITDPSTRLSGIQTEQYDIGFGYEPDMYETLDSNPNLTVHSPLAEYIALVFDKTDGVFTDVKMRQAVNAAIDLEEVAKAALVNNYGMGSSYMFLENSSWYTDAGESSYYEYDPEKAERLLEEAGYNGEEITFLTTREYSYMFNGANVILEQLKAVGMNVNLQVYDWATVVSMRNDPEQWDLFITGLPPTITPIEQLFLSETWVDGPEDEESQAQLQAIVQADSQEEAVKKWVTLQEYYWNILPIIKIADSPDILASTDKVQGLEYLNGPILWNTSVGK